ncbi:hypothetical protein I4F81_011205 [Pyropia yezoensis]|uniref:Uncharacterized protein n=1 Tax=Pyropia yezoensis TaxID=2788 RepID=A0ACC3CG21_PYRYE|nr:hypothetical protein I4F81_011205 [Neopyropia yezoensis]
MEHERPQQTPEETGCSVRRASKPPLRRGRGRPRSGRRPPQGRSASGPTGGQYLAGRRHKHGEPWRHRCGTSTTSRARQVAAEPRPAQRQLAATTSSPQRLGRDPALGQRK